MANKFVSGTLILTLSGFVVKAIGSVNWIILSRILGGEGIGIYQMAFPIYLLALEISSAGIPIAISIITAEKAARKDYGNAKRVFRVSLTLLMSAAVALSIIVYFASSLLIEYHLIRDSRAYYSLIALVPAIFFTTVIAGYRGYLQGWQQMTPTALSQIVEQLVRVATMLAFAYLLLPYGLDYAAGGASLGAAMGGISAWLVLLYFYYKLKRTLPETDPDEEKESVASILKRLIVLAVPISMASIMLPVVSNLDLMIVPYRLEVAAELLLENAVDELGLLLLAQLDGVFAFLAAALGLTDGFLLAAVAQDDGINTELTAALENRSSINCHNYMILS